MPANHDQPSGWLRRLLKRRRWASVGRVGERLAAQHLKHQGYRILASNLRNRFGEIDILAVAPDQRTVVIVEVKSSAQSAGCGSDMTPPEVHVNRHKQRKLVGLACQIARRHRLADRPIRFDVLAVDVSPDRGDTQIRHHAGAFESHV